MTIPATLAGVLMLVIASLADAFPNGFAAHHYDKLDACWHDADIINRAPSIELEFMGKVHPAGDVSAYCVPSLPGQERHK